MVGKRGKKKGGAFKKKQVIVIKKEDSETKLSNLHASVSKEQEEIKKIEKQIYDLEEGHFLETLLTGNVVNGWGNPQEALDKFRYDAIQKKKVLKTGNATVASERQQLDLDKSRIFSYSSVMSPGEELYKTLIPREEAWQIAQDKKETKKLKSAAIAIAAVAAASSDSTLDTNDSKMIEATV